MLEPELSSSFLARAKHVPHVICFLQRVMLKYCGNGYIFNRSPHRTTSAASAGAPPPIAEVQAIVVAPAAVTMTQDLPGRLEAVRTAQVRARVEGVVEKKDRENPLSADVPALVPGGLVPGATTPGSSVPYGSYSTDKLVIPAGLSAECRKNAFGSPG